MTDPSNAAMTSNQKPKKRRPRSTVSMTLNKDGTMTVRARACGGEDVRKIVKALFPSSESQP